MSRKAGPDTGRFPLHREAEERRWSNSRLPAKLLPLVEEYKDRIEKLSGDQGGKLVFEKGDDPKELRRALKAAAGIAQPADPVSVPRGGGGAQLLPGREAGTAGEAAARGGRNSEEARAAEEGEQLRHETFYLRR